MPSRSALMAAAARAAHLEVDQPPYIFEDTLARQLLGAQADELIAYHRTSGSHPVLMGTRLAVTTRARFAEDRLAEAADSGVRQYVILGAGLDSFGYRSASGGLTVFEVDEPSTSAWKRELLAGAGIAVPASVRLVPADLAEAQLHDALGEAGFDMSLPAFVSWLGVTMYLERAAIERTLESIGRLGAGSEIVFDHTLPPAERDDAGTEYAKIAESVNAASGELWVTSLTRADARAIAERAGLTVMAQPQLEDWVDASMWRRNDSIRPSRLWAMTHARVSVSTVGITRS